MKVASSMGKDVLFSYPAKQEREDTLIITAMHLSTPRSTVSYDWKTPENINKYTSERIHDFFMDVDEELYEELWERPTPLSGYEVWLNPV